ncbi:MAG TPA: FAD-dependent oxidoreductase [Polyangiaceae bacterium]|nr:FAD-dependent oxidoreductase [Polyangiaceae bacterium]
MRRENAGVTAGETVVIIGGGIGGLSAALALSGDSADVVIVERDPEPIELDHPTDAFEKWQRPGVPQFRHAHMFLARLQTLVRDRHPQLHAELLAAGLEPSKLEEMLPPGQVTSFRPLPGDEDLKHFWGRRATFEYVLRQHVGKLPHVRFVHSARVEGLVMDVSNTDVRVRGVRVHRAGADETIDGDVVIDASGKRTRCPAWLEAEGARIRFERHPSNRQYVCRHYRLSDGAESPTRQGTGANLDFFGYSVFYAEHGSYAIALGCPTDEKEIARAMHRPDGFDAVCAQIPVLSEWIRQSKVESNIVGAGGFENRWTHYRGNGGKEILGFFAVGDSHIETNPIYGRGTACAFVQAHVLADSLRATRDARARSRRYYDDTFRELRPHFDLSVRTDRMLQSRSEQSRGLPVPAADVFVRKAFEAAWTPAMNRSSLVAREMIKAMEMRELSPLHVRLAVVFHIVWHFFLSLFRREKDGELFAGPPRAEFLRRLPSREVEKAVR